MEPLAASGVERLAGAAATAGAVAVAAGAATGLATAFLVVAFLTGAFLAVAARADPAFFLGSAIPPPPLELG